MTRQILTTLFLGLLMSASASSAFAGTLVYVSECFEVPGSDREVEMTYTTCEGGFRTGTLVNHTSSFYDSHSTLKKQKLECNKWRKNLLNEGVFAIQNTPCNGKSLN